MAANRGWVGETVEDLKQAHEISGRYPEEQAAILTNLAAAHSTFGAFTAAEKVAQQLFRLANQGHGPKVASYVPQMWLNLGLCYETARKIGLAAEVYERAIETAADKDGFTPASAWPLRPEL